MELQLLDYGILMSLSLKTMSLAIVTWCTVFKMLKLNSSPFLRILGITPAAMRHVCFLICCHTNGWASQVETCFRTVCGEMKPFRREEKLGFLNYAEFQHVRCWG